MDKWLLGVAVKFMLSQIAHFGTTTDWGKLKAEVAAYIQTVVYYTWLTPALVQLAQNAVDVVATVLKDAAVLQAIADKAVAGDIIGALVVLRDELAKILVPENDVHVKLKAAVDHLCDCHSEAA